ncbi:MAG: hypothetical protein QOD06_1214 [Candidatus Binatota bacterium]|nr:hypothetical protein [Candidatus Binatota bacterium]
MKIATLIARIALGLVFVVFGLNGFLQFIPQPPTMPEAVVSFMGGLAATRYLLPLLFATQIVGGALLLAGLVPLALVILAPIIVNIVALHIFVAPDGLPIAIVVAALAVFLAWRHRDSYRPLFVPSGSGE